MSDSEGVAVTTGEGPSAYVGRRPSPSGRDTKRISEYYLAHVLTPSSGVSRTQMGVN